MCVLTQRRISLRGLTWMSWSVPDHPSSLRQEPSPCTLSQLEGSLVGCRRTLSYLCSHVTCQLHWRNARPLIHRCFCVSVLCRQLRNSGLWNWHVDNFPWGVCKGTRHPPSRVVRGEASPYIYTCLHLYLLNKLRVSKWDKNDWLETFQGHLYYHWPCIYTYDHISSFLFQGCDRPFTRPLSCCMGADVQLC